MLHPWQAGGESFKGWSQASGRVEVSVISLGKEYIRLSAIQQIKEIKEFVLFVLEMDYHMLKNNGKTMCPALSSMVQTFITFIPTQPCTKCLTSPVLQQNGFNISINKFNKHRRCMCNHFFNMHHRCKAHTDHTVGWDWPANKRIQKLHMGSMQNPKITNLSYSFHQNQKSLLFIHATVLICQIHVTYVAMWTQ